MSRFAVRLAALLLALSCLDGCMVTRGWGAKRRAAAQAKAAEEARQHPLSLGRVGLVNTDDRFVLIDTGSVPEPRSGTILRTYTGGALSGEVRATGVLRQPFVVADIVNGSPQKGDLVLQPAAAEAALPPRAVAAPTGTPALPPVRRTWLGRLIFWK